MFLMFHCFLRIQCNYEFAFSSLTLFDLKHSTLFKEKSEGEV